MEQTVVTQPKRLQPKKPRRRITPATVCQAIHDVPYIVARALIRAVRAVGHCFAWTWDAIASDVRANWRAFCCGRLVTGCRDALRSPALREVHHIMRDHPSIRAITMIAVTAANRGGMPPANLSILKTGKAKAVRMSTMDAICIVVDGDGPHVLDERSEERTYDDLLLRRSLGDKSMQLLLEPGRTVTITHGDDTHTLTTEAERLSSLLRRSGIRLGEDEMVELNVAGEDPAIRISDTLTYQHYVTVETDYKILRSPDPLMDKGTEEIIRKGIPGQIVETYEDTVVSGEVVSTKYIGASHDTSHAELVRYGTRVYEVEEGDTIEKDFPNEVGEGGYLLFASGDTMTYNKVMLCSSTAYYSGGDGGAAEAQQLFLHVRRDGGIVRLLHLVAVDAKGRKSLLSVRSQHGGQVHRARAFSAVKAPHALDGVAIHVHGFRAVAPAGRHREGDGHAVSAEFFFTGGGLGHAADGGVGDDDLHRFAVGIAQVLFKELRSGSGHIHGLLLQAFAHLQRAAAAVDGGTDADDGIGTHISVFCHDFSSLKIFMYDIM